MNVDKITKGFITVALLGAANRLRTSIGQPEFEETSTQAHVAHFENQDASIFLVTEHGDEKFLIISPTFPINEIDNLKNLFQGHKLIGVTLVD